VMTSIPLTTAAVSPGYRPTLPPGLLGGVPTGQPRTTGPTQVAATSVAKVGPDPAPLVSAGGGFFEALRSRFTL